MNSKKRSQAVVVVSDDENDDKKAVTSKKLKSAPVDVKEKTSGDELVVMTARERDELQKLVDSGNMDTVKMDYVTFQKSRNNITKMMSEWLATKDLVNLVWEYDPFVPLVLECVLHPLGSHGGVHAPTRPVYLTNFAPAWRRFELLALDMALPGFEGQDHEFHHNFSTSLVVSDQTHLSTHGHGSFRGELRLVQIAVYDPTGKGADRARPWIAFFNYGDHAGDARVITNRIKLGGGAMKIASRYHYYSKEKAGSKHIEISAPSLERLHGELAELTEVWDRYGGILEDSNLCDKSVRELFQLYTQGELFAAFKRIQSDLDNEHTATEDEWDDEMIQDSNTLREFYKKYAQKGEKMLIAQSIDPYYTEDAGHTPYYTEDDDDVLMSSDPFNRAQSQS